MYNRNSYMTKAVSYLGLRGAICSRFHKNVLLIEHTLSTIHIPAC